MQSPPDTVAHFVPKVTVSLGDGVGIGIPQAQSSLQFFNNLSVPVTVVDRLGVKTHFTGTRARFTGEFIIRQVDKYQPAVNLDVADLLSDCGAEPSKLAVQVAEALRQVPSLNRTLITRQSDLTKDFTIYQDDIRRNGGSLYVVGLDLVVSLLPPHLAPLHPYQMACRREALLHTDHILNKDSGFHYQIKIVDKAGQFGQRYININGEVYAVPVIRETTYQDGVYIVSTHPSPTGEVFVYPRADYYQFEDAEKKLALYRTALDAETLGDPQSAFKRDLDARANQLKLSEHEMRVEKQQIEREALRRTSEFEQRKAQWERESVERQHQLELSERAWKERKHQLDQEALIVKDRLDERSTRRKAVLETLKYGPSVVVGIWAIVKAIQKLQEKK